MIHRRAAAGLVALALAAALPAAAYVLPAAAILKRLGERRAALQLEALEVTGSFEASGPAADALATRAGLARGPGGAVLVPARFQLKVPGRCRLELGAGEGPERPAVSLKDGRLQGRGGLEVIPAAQALVRAACVLLAESTAGDASARFAAAFSRRGVDLQDVSLGRFDGRIAFVIGGRAKDAKPLAFVDKDGFQPLRLVAAEPGAPAGAGALLDVRLLGWGSPTGGDWFPRAVEAWEGGALRVRFTAEKATPNPRLPDAAF